MSHDDSPPSYPGPPNMENPRLFPDTKSRFPSDQKDPRRLQAEHGAQNPHNTASSLQSGPSTPRPSSAPGNDYRGTSTGPIPPIPAQAGNIPSIVVFHVYTTKRKRGKELDVTINGKTDVAFHVFISSWRLFSSRPDVTIHRASSSGPVIATARLRSGFSSYRVELNFPQAGTSTEMKPSAWWSRAYTLVLEGQFLEWKGTHHHGASSWSGASLKLVDSNGRIYAVYADVTHKALTKQGRLSIEVPELSDNMIEQIVCSGIALAEKERRDTGTNGGLG